MQQAPSSKVSELCCAGLKRCLAARAAALRANATPLFEGDDDEEDLDMLIVDARNTLTDSRAAEGSTASAWVDGVVGHLCSDEDVKDSIYMVLLMAVVCLNSASSPAPAGVQCT